MPLVCEVLYKSSVFKDLRKIDKTQARRILDSIENDLAADPLKGSPLEGSFKGLYKFRIGSYMVIYSKLENGILILRIGHRKNVYKDHG